MMWLGSLVMKWINYAQLREIKIEVWVISDK